MIVIDFYIYLKIRSLLGKIIEIETWLTTKILRVLMHLE